MDRFYRTICSHVKQMEIAEDEAEIREIDDLSYACCGHCRYSYQWRGRNRNDYTWVRRIGSPNKYHLALITVRKKTEEEKAKAKKEEKKSLADLLQRRIFAAHSTADIDPDEELACYQSEQEALMDPCCNYVTELLVVRSRNREDVVKELKQKGVEIQPDIEDDGKRPDSKKVVELTRKAKQAGTSIKKLIQQHLHTTVSLNQLSNSHVDYILSQLAKVGPACNTGPERMVEEEAGESPIVGG
jgi:hypothetical protein